MGRRRDPSASRVYLVPASTQEPAEELVGYFLGKTFSSEDNPGYIGPAEVSNFVAQLSSLGVLYPRIFTV